VRKFALIGFICLFSYQLIGFFGFVEIEHYFIRKNMKQALKLTLPTRKLSTFHFSAHERRQLKWRNAHEFVLNGHFYDVIHKRVQKNGDIELRCIDDKQETTLFAKLNSIASEQLTNVPLKHPLHAWVKLFKEPYPEIKNAGLVLAKVLVLRKPAQTKFIQNSYFSPPFKIPSPPPEWT
jgi:hypothetical protein